MHRPRNDRERMRKGTPYSQYELVLAGLLTTGQSRIELHELTGDDIILHRFAEYKMGRNNEF
jgi:hypothetical protein